MGVWFPPAGSGRLCQGGHCGFHPLSAGLARRRRRDAAWAGVAGAGFSRGHPVGGPRPVLAGPKGVKLGGPAPLGAGSAAATLRPRLANRGAGRGRIADRRHDHELSSLRL